MQNSGFTIIEILIVIAFISILLYMGISVTNKFAARRSIDDITYKISSSLNISKLQAARGGVEFETDLIFNEGILSLNTYRGSSNRNSDFSNKLLPSNPDCLNDTNTSGSICPLSALDIRISGNYTIVPNRHVFQFNPNGTAGLPRTINIRPSSEETNINKCGRVVVSPLGRIRTAIGNWDGATCNTIGDIQDNEAES